MTQIATCPLCPKSTSGIKPRLYSTVINDKEVDVCGHHLKNPNDKSAIVEELKEVVKEIQKRAPIKKVSDKRKVQDRIYLKKRKEFMKDHPNCEINVHGCRRKATEVHHSKGKVGKNYTDETTFVATCDNCHRWAETHPNEAKEMGVSQSRLK